MKKDIGLIMRELSKLALDNAIVSSQTPFQVLIATVLSQRTKDANTGKAAKALFSQYKTPKALSKAPLREIEKLVKAAGFFRVKAKRIKEISQIIAEKYDGKLPCNRKQLEVLPGVGPKTSACTMVYGFGKPAICVDVHVHRISNRLGLVNTKTPEETEAELTKLVPKKYWLKLNHSMVRFGQKICLPRNPRHEECALKKQCDFFQGKGQWKK